MTERWSHPRDAAAEAVVWSLISSVAEENKKAARDYVAGYLRSENSRGVDALANGRVIGSVTRSKPSEKRDVDDMAAFLQYVAAHQPELLTIDYRAKEALLRKLHEVTDDQGVTVFLDPDGVPVPGVGTRLTTGTVKVNPDGQARELVRELLSQGRISLDGVHPLELKPEPTDRYTQDARGY